MKTKLSAYKLFRAVMVAFVLAIMVCASVVFAEDIDLKGPQGAHKSYVQLPQITVRCDCGDGVDHGALPPMALIDGTYEYGGDEAGGWNFTIKGDQIYRYVDAFNKEFEKAGIPEHFIKDYPKESITLQHHCTLDGLMGGLSYVNMQFPTCTESGYRNVQCTYCGRRWEHVEIPALGHNLDKENPIEQKDPTCTEPGYKLYKCTNGPCTYTERETLEPTRHYIPWMHSHDKNSEHPWYVSCDKCDEAFDPNDPLATGKSNRCEQCNPEYWNKSRNAPLTPASTVPSDNQNKDAGTLPAAGEMAVTAASASLKAVASTENIAGTDATSRAPVSVERSEYEAAYNAKVGKDGAGPAYKGFKGKGGVTEGYEFEWSAVGNQLFEVTVSTSKNVSSEYTVKWVTTNDEGEEVVLDEETRDDVKAEDTAKVTDADKAKIIDGYVFDEGNANNVLEKVVEADGSTVLVLYMKKSETPLYTVHWVDVATGRELKDPEVRDDYAVGDLAQVTEPDKAVTFTGYKFRADLDQKWSDVITENGEVHLYLYYEAEGGGNNPGGDPETPPENPPENPPTTPDNPGEDIPTPDVPLTDLPVENPPLTELPEEETPLEDIPEEETPLSGVPQTGDISALWTVMALLTGAGLIWMVLDSKKRKEDA